VIGEGRNSNVWLQDLDGEVQTKFTFNEAMRDPLWSPDGNIMFLASARSMQSVFFRKPSNGGGTEELVLQAGANGYLTSISADGKWLAYSETGSKTKEDIWLLPLAGDRKPVVYLDSPFDETHAQFSPDGKWMAYTSNESGLEQVYMQSIPATGAKRQVSSNGGRRPRWRRDGKELFYISMEAKLMAVPAKLSASGFDFGKPQQLFDKTLDFRVNFRDFGYQPTADGQRFLAVLPEEKSPSERPAVTIRTNWQAGLKK
jgi:Tol biopolymer transport system component